MMLPMHHKTSHVWPRQALQNATRLRNFAYVSLTVLFVGIFCTVICVTEYAEVSQTVTLAKRGVVTNGAPDSEPKIEKVVLENKIDSKTLSEASTTVVSVAHPEAQVDLLGGLSALMTNFYVGQMSTIISEALTPHPTPTTVPGDDVFQALSQAFREAMDRANSSNILSLRDGQGFPKQLKRAWHEKKGNEDLTLWQSHPLLLNTLSGIASQVCAIDLGAGARLIDTILSSLPMELSVATSIISVVVRQSKISAADILPVIIPAVATAVGQEVHQVKIADAGNMEGIMANVILNGNVFVKEVMSSETSLENTELHMILNQVAGLMCAAAKHLSLPICIMSTEASGKAYSMIIPCDCADSGSGISVTRSLSDYSAPQATCWLDWSTSTIEPTAEYSFTLPDVSSLLSASGQTFVPEAMPTSAPAYGQNPPKDGYGEPKASPTTSCTTTQPGAYVANTPTAYDKPSTTAQPLVCPPCSCQEEAPLSYAHSYGEDEPAQETRPQSNCVSSVAKPCESGDGSCPGPLPAPTMMTETYSKPDEYQSQSLIPGYAGQDMTEWKYMGCYRDSPKRILEQAGRKDYFEGGMSNGKCMEDCTWMGFAFAGTEDGKECWCGQEVKGEAEELAKSACSSPCQGHGEESCGGAWAISVYSRSRGKRAEQYGSMAELLAMYK